MEKPPSLSLVKRDASSAYPLDLHVSSLSADTTAPSTPEEGDAVAVTDDSSPLDVSRLNSSSDAFLCNSSSPPAEEENTSFASHGDSFYASLIAAQQLRRQRGVTATCAASRCRTGCRAAKSAHASPNLSCVSLVSCIALEISASQRTKPPSLSLCLLTALQPPRILRELLARRQMLSEALVKE